MTEGGADIDTKPVTSYKQRAEEKGNLTPESARSILARIRAREQAASEEKQKAEEKQEMMSKNQDIIQQIREKPGIIPTPLVENERESLVKRLIDKIRGVPPARPSPQPPQSNLIPQAEIKYPVSTQSESDPAKKDWIPKATFPYERKQYAPQGTAAERLRRAEKSGITDEQSQEISKREGK